LRHNDQGRVQQTLTQPSPACATEAAGPRKINEYIFINLNLKKINKKNAFVCNDDFDAEKEDLISGSETFRAEAT
jgi:hypothetical protein